MSAVLLIYGGAILLGLVVFWVVVRR